MNIKKMTVALTAASVFAAFAPAVNVLPNVFDVTASAKVTADDLKYSSKSVNTSYSGNNIGANNYIWFWAENTNSYLEKTDNGYMCVQSNAVSNKILVEYFDDNFKALSNKLINYELPKFGAFYATESNYYILSGQDNPNDSDSVEVFRVTKYDKDWNRLSAVSMYGENTSEPFGAGSARITHSGKYMLIRTCHGMYKSNDGYKHQANVTIEINTDTMTVTDKYTDVMNTNLGYVSHSFNQFIQLDGNNVVGLDHGDANPRSVALLKYSVDITSGKFVPDYFNNPCTVVDMLPISGTPGDNNTGVQVGGFELSDSSYIVAGTTTDQSNVNSTVRNIFISSVDRALNTNPVITKITNYSENSASACNPHLVKIDGDSFMLLWQRDGESGKTYYTLLDARGRQTGDIKTISADLSDCQPIFVDGALVWYTWNSTTVTFNKFSVARPCVHGNITPVGETASTCTKEGLGAHFKCPDCGRLFSDAAGTQTVTASELKLPLAAHNFVDDPNRTHLASAGTCQVEATYFKVCSGCGIQGKDTFKGDKDADNHLHTSAEKAIEPTCTDPGNSGKVTCDDCGAVVKNNEVIPALGHKGGEATCSVKAKCDVCGEKYGELDNNNHKNTEKINVKAATETEEGYTGDTYCLDCQKITEQGITINKLSHSAVNRPVGEVTFPSSSDSDNSSNSSGVSSDSNSSGNSNSTDSDSGSSQGHTESEHANSSDASVSTPTAPESNPSTGAALSVLPIAAAISAVVIIKKKK